MNKPDFLFLLLGASYTAFKFAEQFVTNDLKTEFRYDLELNMSYDHSDLVQFDVYPEDDGKQYSNLTDEEVVEMLCRNNKVPVWIDIAVAKANKTTTTFRLLCAGRYSDDKNEFYYKDRGSGSFGIKSPNFPPRYKEGTKFELKE